MGRARSNPGTAGQRRASLLPDRSHRRRAPLSSTLACGRRRARPHHQQRRTGAGVGVMRQSARFSRADAMKLAVIVVSAITLTMPVRAQDVLGSTGVSGAGSTFVYPILSRWSRDYRTSTARGSEFAIPNGGLEDPPATSALEYEPVGSLAGMLRVKDRRVDF